MTDANPLKVEKKQLKEFIKLNEGYLFINLLGRHCSAKKIKKMGNSLYEESLTRRAFNSLVINLRNKREEVT